MNTTDKKMYLIPETEALSLESVYSIMSMSDAGGGSGDPDPGSIVVDPAPKRVLF